MRAPIEIVYVFKKCYSVHHWRHLWGWLLMIVYCRADTRSEAGRSYNETIIRPVTRRLHTPAGTSVRSRSSRSHAGTSEVCSNKLIIKLIFGSYVMTFLRLKPQTWIMVQIWNITNAMFDDYFWTTSTIPAKIFQWIIVLNNNCLFVDRMVEQWRRETEDLRLLCLQYINSTGYTWVIDYVS